MTHKHRTKDEHFVITLYDEAKKTGDLESSLNRYTVGTKAHLNPKAVDAICKLLVQANFIKKSSELEIYLTPHGIKLAERLIEETFDRRIDCK